MVIKLNKDAVYRAAKPTGKDCKINDGGGLSLMVEINGENHWLFRYQFDGKPNQFGFGEYPAVTLEGTTKPG